MIGSDLLFSREAVYHRCFEIVFCHVDVTVRESGCCCNSGFVDNDTCETINFSRRTCTHEPLGYCVYQENKSDERVFPPYTTRKGCVTVLYHAIENTGASKAIIISARKSKRTMEELCLIPLNCTDRWEGSVEFTTCRIP